MITRDSSHASNSPGRFVSLLFSPHRAETVRHKHRPIAQTRNIQIPLRASRASQSSVRAADLHCTPKYPFYFCTCCVGCCLLCNAGFALSFRELKSPTFLKRNRRQGTATARSNRRSRVYRQFCLQMFALRKRDASGYGGKDFFTCFSEQSLHFVTLRLYR